MHISATRGIRPLLLLACIGAVGSAHADYVGSLGPIDVPASAVFSNSTASHLAVGTLAPPNYNFRDRWSFTLGSDANLMSLVAAFSYDGTFGIDNIQVNLLNAAGLVALGWQNVTLSGPFSTSVSITPVSGLMAGDYTLQVRGLLLGPPASYSGSLIASAPAVVPLPAALPLLLLGAGVLSAAARKRKPG